MDHEAGAPHVRHPGAPHLLHSAWPGVAFAEQWRDYRACKRPRWSNIEVDYTYKRKAHRPHSKKRWRVSSKSAYWL